MASAPKNTNFSRNAQDGEKPLSQENDGNRPKKRCRQNLRRRKWKNKMHFQKKKADAQKGSLDVENIAQSERNENIDESKRNTGEEGSPGESQQYHKVPERVPKKPKLMSVHVESLRRSEAGLWAGFGRDCLLVYTRSHRVRKLLVEERGADGRMEQAWSTKIQIKLHGSVKPHPPRSTSDKEIRPTNRQRKTMRLSRPAPPPSIQAVCCLPDSRVVVRDAAATHFYTSDMTWRLRWFRGDYGHLVAVLDSALVYCSQQEAEETRHGPPACRLQLFSDSKHNLIRTLPWHVSSERVSICRHPHCGKIALVDQDDKSLHIYRSLHCTDPEIRIPLRFAPILSNAVAAVDDFIIVAEPKSLHVFTWEGEKVERWGNGMKETGEWMRCDGDVKKGGGDEMKEHDEMEHGDAKKEDGDVKKGDGDVKKEHGDEMKHGDVKKEDGDVKTEDSDTKKEHVDEMKEHGNAKKGNGDAKKGDGDAKMGDGDEKKKDDDIKKEDGDIGKEDCNKKKEDGEKKGDCDEKGGDIKKVDGDIEREDGDIKMEEDGENNGDRDDVKIDLVKTKGSANKDEGKEEVHGEGAEYGAEEEAKGEDANVEQERNGDEASGSNDGGNRKRRDIFENFDKSRESTDSILERQYDRLDNALGMASPWHVVQGIAAVGGRVVLVEGDGPVRTEIRRIHLYEVRAAGEEESAGCDVVKTGEMFDKVLKVV